MVRAQAAAASLVATMDVLSRFVTNSLQPGPRAAERDASKVAERQETEPIAAPAAAPIAMETHAVASTAAEPVVELAREPQPEPIAVEETPVAPASLAAPAAVEELPAPPAMTESEPAPIETMASAVQENAWDQPPVAEVPASNSAEEPVAPVELALGNEFEPMPPEAASFDLALLPLEEQELHRRANRVAKVSMQDIKLLRPGDVALGRTHRDLCLRLRDDIDKAYKEYDRRFQSILGHPVDYFYDWMVEILAGGDPGALGEYPFPTAAVRR
jgi:hypothetical protein